MTADEKMYALVDSQIVGPGLKIEAAVFVEPERQADPAEGKKIILDAIVEIANGAYREGRASVLESFDDLALLRDAFAALHALGQLLGSYTAGDRHRRAADVIARLIKQHEEEGGR